MKKSFSAGGVVINTDGNVLVVNQDGVSWSLPKGHIDPGETVRQAAEREIKEESGISALQFIKDLGSYERFQIGKGGIGENMNDLKHISMILFSTKQTLLAPEDPRHPDACWIEPENVTALLTHSKDKAFYERILPEVKLMIASQG